MLILGISSKCDFRKKSLREPELSYAWMCVRMCVCVFLFVWAIKNRWPEQPEVCLFPPSISWLSSSLCPNCFYHSLSLSLISATSQTVAHSLLFICPPSSCPCCLSSWLQLVEAQDRGSSAVISSRSASLTVSRDSEDQPSFPPLSLSLVLFLFLCGVRLMDLICLAFIMNPTVKIHLQNGTHFNTYMYQVGAVCEYYLQLRLALCLSLPISVLMVPHWDWDMASSPLCSLLFDQNSDTAFVYQIRAPPPWRLFTGSSAQVHVCEMIIHPALNFKRQAGFPLNFFDSCWSHVCYCMRVILHLCLSFHLCRGSVPFFVFLSWMKETGMHEWMLFWAGAFKRVQKGRQNWGCSHGFYTFTLPKFKWRVF